MARSPSRIVPSLQFQVVADVSRASRAAAHSFQNIVEAVRRGSATAADGLRAEPCETKRSRKLGVLRHLAIFSFALVAFTPMFLKPTAAAMLMGAGFISLAPLVLFVSNRTFSPFPFCALAGLFYLAFFVLPSFVIEPAWWRSGPGADGGIYGVVFDKITAETASLVLLGVVMMIATYYLVGVLLRPRHARPQIAEPPGLPLPLIVTAIAVAHVVFMLTPALRRSSPLAQVMNPIGYVAFGALYLTLLEKRLPRWIWIAFVVLIAAEIAASFIDGLVTPAILLVIFLGTIYWYARRRVGPVIAAGVICIFVAFPVLKLANPTALMTSGPISDHADADNPVAKIIHRMALVVTLQYVVDLTPERIPYARGGTLRNLITNPIPRIVWRGEAHARVGGVVGPSQLNPH